MKHQAVLKVLFILGVATGVLSLVDVDRRNEKDNWKDSHQDVYNDEDKEDEYFEDEEVLDNTQDRNDPWGVILRPRFNRILRHTRPMPCRYIVKKTGKPVCWFGRCFASCYYHRERICFF